MYWLVLSTLFWSHAFGPYSGLESCERAAPDVPAFTRAICVRAPDDEMQPHASHGHAH